MKKICAILIILIAVVGSILVSCDTAKDVRNVEMGASANVQPVDYGNGVYYFPFVQAKFGNALSKFIGMYPYLEVLAISGNGNGTNGRDMGYFVVFKEKKE